MNRRIAAFELAQRDGLTPAQVRGLLAQRGQAADPRVEVRALARAASIAAAALVGLGVILWIAANWAEFGRTGKFALLQSVIVVMALGAMLRPVARLPLLLLALLGQGAVLAFFGQTYQTGADPWQLFALWALLALPWCLAARSEVLWAPWTLVGAVAASLWVHAHQGRLWAPDEASTTVHLVGWLAVFALAALSCPWPPLRKALGTGPWSFRTGIALAAVMVTLSGLTALFGQEIAPSYGLALLVLLAAAMLLAVSRVRDVFALCALVLAFDTLLVAGLGRWLFDDTRGEWLGRLFLLGIAAALLVAGTVAIVMRLAGWSMRSAGSSGTFAANARPWPVVLLAFLGAQLAAWPLIAFVAVLIGDALVDGIAPYFIGPLLVVGACVVLRSREALLFVEHLALVALLVGLGVLCFRLMRDLGDAAGGLSSAALMLAVAYTLPMAWVRAILGACAACTAFFALARFGWLEGRADGSWHAASALALAWAAALAVQARVAIESTRWRLAAAMEPTLGGWLMATLAVFALTSGMSLLVGGMLGSVGGAAIDAAAGRPMGSPNEGWTRWLSWPVALSVACVLVAWAWCASRGEAQKALLRSPLALIALAVAALLAAFMPALGPVLALGLLARTTGRPWQASAALLAGAWIVGAFYYSLNWELPTKASVLMAAGAVLGAMAWAVRPATAQIQYRQAIGSRAAATWSALGLLATLAVVNIGIWQKEDVIARGRPVYIELAPVDPRSLMQGDYMALDYRLGKELLSQLDAASTLERPRAAASVDERGIARLERLATSSLASGELVVELTPKNGRWIIASDAWFFREGEGQRWQRARYGEFRVDRQGRALLVGLADEQLRRIEP